MVVALVIRLAYRKRYVVTTPFDMAASDILFVYLMRNTMTTPDSRKPLWANLVALMQERYGTENLNRLARECKFSPATASRIKAQDTSVGLETIDKLAATLGVRPCDLIDPDFAPGRSEQIKALSPMALDLAQMLDAIEDPARQDQAYAIAAGVLQFGSTPQPRENGAVPTDAGADSSVPAPSPRPIR